MISFFWGGDFRHFYSENIPDFINFPFAWDSSLNTGIGHSQIGSLWIIAYFNLTLLLNKLGLTWNLISLLFWILPSILLSFFSALFLFNHLFKSKIRYSLLSGIIYTFNTYFLMILTGGQLGVCLAYSLAPLVLLRFIKIIENPSLRNVLISGLVLALQLVFDPRIVYVTLAAVSLYIFFNFSKLTTIKQKIFFLAPFFISALFNMFWILPLILTKSSPIPHGFDSVKGFEFFSFSDFSHALSLLHPNWPENIFGKVYFLQPEFLILPILAFGSLLFISNIKNQISKMQFLFFALLGLMGGFLAKGASPPFGEGNIWLFQYFPGIVMLRDPTKWYILIALSYSMLIPHGLFNIASWINSKFKIPASPCTRRCGASQRGEQNLKLLASLKLWRSGQLKMQNLFLLLIVCYLLFLIRPLWFGELKQKLKPREVPKEYVLLKDFLVSKPYFFRTLWIPQWQRFGYFSNNHPAIGRYEILKSASASGQIKELSNDDTKTLLKNLGVKYIIVPYDSEGEIFLEDRKYSEKQYAKAIDELRKIRWLREIDFGKIALFEVPSPKDHFFIESRFKNQELRISYKMADPTKYLVSIKSAKGEERVVFSEGYDKYWEAKMHNSSFIIPNSKYNEMFNSFVLPKSGDYSLDIYYKPQSLVNLGLVVSIGGFIAVITILVDKKIKKR